MSASAFLFERNVTAAPLGVRFWDTVATNFVRDGLKVVAYPTNNSARRVSGYLAGSSTFAFRGLPGLGPFERSVGTDNPWRPPPSRRPFVVEATDTLGRFLPVRFTVGVPNAGIFSPSTLLPDMSPGAVPLFSSAGRMPPGAGAVVRAELRDAYTNAPAAWALVEARAGGVLIGRGISDAAGNLAIMGPYPALPDVAFDSPLSVPVPLSSQTWPVTLAAWYSPVRPAPKMPDLDALLTQQAANLWASPALASPFGGAVLSYGRDLVARSFDPSTGQGLPFLLMTSSASPL